MSELCNGTTFSRFKIGWLKETFIFEAQRPRRPTSLNRHCWITTTTPWLAGSFWVISPAAYTAAVHGVQTAIENWIRQAIDRNSPFPNMLTFGFYSVHFANLLDHVATVANACSARSLSKTCCELFLAPAFFIAISCDFNDFTKGMVEMLCMAWTLLFCSYRSFCASYSFIVQPNLIFVTSLCFIFLSASTIFAVFWNTLFGTLVKLCATMVPKFQTCENTGFT